MKSKQNHTMTDWFPPDVKPVHVGVYEIKLSEYNFEVYSYWDGSRWCFACINVDDAFSLKHRETKLFQKRYWRGLAKKP